MIWQLSTKRKNCLYAQCFLPWCFEHWLRSWGLYSLNLPQPPVPWGTAPDYQRVEITFPFFSDGLLFSGENGNQSYLRVSLNNTVFLTELEIELMWGNIIIQRHLSSLLSVEKEMPLLDRQHYFLLIFRFPSQSPRTILGIWAVVLGDLDHASS